MSVATEGSEEIVTWKISQAYKINQIYTRINELLMQRQDQTVVKINFPELDKCNVQLCQAILDKFDAEIIGKNLFIKIDRGHKEEIQGNLLVSGRTHNRNWLVTLNTYCVMMKSIYKSDVGIWFQRPTYAQLHNPIINTCPPPDVFIEVFYNHNPDRQLAFDKLVVIQQHFPEIEYIGIALPDSQDPFHQNPNPVIPSVSSTPQNPLNVKSTCAPYFIYWDGTNQIYYKIDWNQHLILKCGWMVEFNDVLEVISKP